MPCDINGDGKIDENFMVQGMDTGMECFNPEWLFRIPVKIEGPIRNIRGEKIISRAGVNIRQAYGLDLRVPERHRRRRLPGRDRSGAAHPRVPRRDSVKKTTTDFTDNREGEKCPSIFPIRVIREIRGCKLLSTRSPILS